jgi:flagellar biosynthesis/type III secretory pathway protein FliH
MRHAAFTIAATAVLALACSSAMAQWKWRDASGRITASDLPPPSTVPDRDVLTRPAEQRQPAAAPKLASAASAAPGAAAPQATTGSDPELEARRKRVADEQSAQQRQLQARNDAARAENCARAQAYAAALSEGQRISRSNAQGELTILDDAGRAAELQRARAAVASDCK